MLRSDENLSPQSKGSEATALSPKLFPRLSGNIDEKQQAKDSEDVWKDV